MVNYRELQQHLNTLKEYKHGSSHAEIVDGNYNVYSYRTLMLRYNTQTNTYYGEIIQGTRVAKKIR